MMEGRLKDAGFALAFDSIRCKFKPTEQTLQLCEESGTDLAQEVRRRQKLKERSSECEGRVWGVACGRACVLTCMWMLAHECEHAQAERACPSCPPRPAPSCGAHPHAPLPTHHHSPALPCTAQRLQSSQWPTAPAARRRRLGGWWGRCAC